MANVARAGQTTRIVVVGGGFGGAYAAKEATKRLGSREFEVVLLDRNNFLLFYPLLIEAGVGSIEARHVVVPLRKFLKGETYYMAEVDEIDLGTQTVRYRVSGQEEKVALHYDHLLLALGSETKESKIDGLSEFGFTIKSLDDAIGLRDRAIRLLELANTLKDSEKRKELLTCVTVGANYTGIEFAGEFQAFMKEAAKSYANIDPSEIGMVVLEYSDRILPATPQRLTDWCKRTLEGRGVKIQTETTLTQVSENWAVTTKGEKIPTHTVVWAAGIAPNPLLGKIQGVPLNKHGYLDCNADLSVKGFENVWAVGDCATVLDPAGKPFPATAQTATREGPHAIRNIAAKLRGEPTQPFNHKNLGSFAAIGRKQAAAEVLSFQFAGTLGWLLYRGTYLMKMPTLGMKVRLLADWTTEIVFKNEPVQLGVRRYRDGRHDRLLEN